MRTRFLGIFMFLFFIFQGFVQSVKNGVPLGCLVIRFPFAHFSSSPLVVEHPTNDHEGYYSHNTRQKQNENISCDFFKHFSQ